jgi:hypothetical protein
MYLNHFNESAYNFTTGRESLCPECGAELIAKQGSIKIWHWSHKKASSSGSGCSYAGESEWHILLKDVLSRKFGYLPEFKIEINGKTYRADLYDQKNNRPIELVHSLNDSYFKKYLDYKNYFSHQTWIFDGDHFSTGRPFKEVKSNIKNEFGVKNLLKRKSSEFVNFTNGYIHLRNFKHRKILKNPITGAFYKSDIPELDPYPSFWKHWRNNIYYESKNSTLIKVAESYYEEELNLSLGEQPQ